MLTSENAYIEIKNLSINYENQSNPKLICDQLNLKLNAGEIIGILGPNGSGKSSLINAILGKILYQGEISYIGFPKKKPKISFIPQDYKSSFFSWASLKNNIKFTQDNFYRQWKGIDLFIDKEKKGLGINFELDIKPKNCSGGMLQQASILRAICSQEGVILADEPFSALDVNINRTIRSRFRRIIKQKNIVCMMILHNMDDIISICDKLIVIPNKPYSSKKQENGFYQIQEFINNHISRESKNADSLLEIAKKVFQSE